MTTKSRVIVTLIVLVAVFAGIVTFLLVSTQSANAGQTGGFAPYAKQGIVNRLNYIYGPGGNPYKVTCSEADSFNYHTDQVNDSIVCHVRSK